MAAKKKQNLFKPYQTLLVGNISKDSRQSRKITSQTKERFLNSVGVSCRYEQAEPSHSYTIPLFLGAVDYYFCFSVIMFLNISTISACFSLATVPSLNLLMIFIAGLPDFFIPQNVSISRGKP